MASAAVRAWEGVSRWEKSFFVGVGRVEDDAVVAPVHLAMRAIFISLCHARRVIRCSVVAPWPVCYISSCVLVPDGLLKLPLGDWTSPLGAHTVDDLN